MIKECLITLTNDIVTVVKYGDTFVQFPAVHPKGNTLFVKYENDKYVIIDSKTAEEDVITNASTEDKSIDKTSAVITKKTTKKNAKKKVQKNINEDANV
jgi:hypothetical protein